MLFMKRNENFKLRDNASCCQIKVYGFLHLSLFMLVYITCTFMLLKAIYRCSIKTFCNKMLWSTTFKRDNVFPDQQCLIMQPLIRLRNKVWYIRKICKYLNIVILLLFVSFSSVRNDIIILFLKSIIIHIKYKRELL